MTKDLSRLHHLEFFVLSVKANEDAGQGIRPTSPESSDEQLPEKEIGYKFDAEVNLPCFVLMLDVLLKQVSCCNGMR